MTDERTSSGGPARRRRLAFLIPLLGFLVLAGFASVALLATLRGERDMTQLPAGSISAAELAGRPFLVNVLPAGARPAGPRHRHWPFSPNRSISLASPIRTGPRTA